MLRRLQGLKFNFRRGVTATAGFVGLSLVPKFFSSAAEGGGMKLGSLKGLKMPGGGAAPLIDKAIDGKHYDIAVMGGGSGGIALAYEAKKLGLSTVLFDYVEPSAHGSKWGLGGTCVNVGCIPKKLMHTAALHGEAMVNAYDFGWNLDVNTPAIENDHAAKKKFFAKFDWSQLVNNVQQYIRSLNFGYKSELAEEGIAYVNALAMFQDKNTILFSPKKESLEHYLQNKEVKNDGSVGKITADYVIVAVGGRPNNLDNAVVKTGSEHAITSDDLFSLKKAPGKTLVLGGGYIAVECAGFLGSLGYDTTIMTRAIFLRSFDRDMANKVIHNLAHYSEVRTLGNTLPSGIEKVGEKYKVKWTDAKSKKEIVEEFDTILTAIGRTPNTKFLNLESIGLKVNNKSLKIEGGVDGEIEKTNVSGVYAIGDVLQGIPELTPVAKKSGQLLARRIALLKKGVTSGRQYEDTKMDYHEIPTTIFSPLEYSCVGYSEEEAIVKYGKGNVDVYHVIQTPLEEQLSTRIDKEANTKKKKFYAKIVVLKEGDQKVLGFHYIGPNAGEIMQPLAIALKMGVTKRILDSVVGIHPTIAEEFIQMDITKSSGEDPEKTGC